MVFLYLTELRHNLWVEHVVLRITPPPIKSATIKKLLIAAHHLRKWTYQIQKTLLHFSHISKNIKDGIDVNGVDL